jgi:hypothetical protein
LLYPAAEQVGRASDPVGSQSGVFGWLQLWLLKYLLYKINLHLTRQLCATYDGHHILSFLWGLPSPADYILVQRKMELNCHTNKTLKQYN